MWDVVKHVLLKQQSLVLQPPLSTNQTLIVNVIDEQDTAPYFIGLPYRVTTEENKPVGTQLLTVTALDGDTQNPRAVQYYFIDQSKLPSVQVSLSVRVVYAEVSPMPLLL